MMEGREGGGEAIRVKPGEWERETWRAWIIKEGREGGGEASRVKPGEWEREDNYQPDS